MYKQSNSDPPLNILKLVTLENVQYWTEVSTVYPLNPLLPTFFSSFFGTQPKIDSFCLPTHRNFFYL